MPAKTAVDVDAVTSEVHAIVDRIKADEGDPTALKDEAETKIRTLPTDKRRPLRNTVNAAVTEATDRRMKAVEPITPRVVKPSRVDAYAEDPLSFKGVPKLVRDGVKAFSEGMALGTQFANVGERLARIILEMRMSIPNPDAANLPDLTSIRKTTKNGANLIYDEVLKGIADDDVKQLATHSSLVRASQNKASDVLVDWLDSFDTSPLEDSRAIMDERFPGATALLDADTELRPSDAIRALYEKHEITLPRYGRTALMRIDRRVKSLGEATKALEAAEDAENEPLAAELKARVDALKSEIPAEFLEATKEKTDAERTADALKDVRTSIERAGKRYAKVKTTAQKRKAKAELYKIIREAADTFGLDLSALVGDEA